MSRSLQCDLKREINTKKYFPKHTIWGFAAPTPPPWTHHVFLNPSWEVLAFLGSTPANDKVIVLKLKTRGMHGVPTCKGMFVSKQPICHCGNLQCHLPRWMLVYLRRPAENRNVGQKQQRVSSYWETHTFICTQTHIPGWISPVY